MNDQNTPQEYQPDNTQEPEETRPEYYQQDYQQNNQQQNQQYYSPQPMQPLKTNRSLLKFLLYGFVTLGIYNYICLYYVSKDINTIASRYDNRKTLNYLIMALIISPLTFGIGEIVWYHLLSSRVGNELKRRNYDYQFGVKDFWIFKVLFDIIPAIISLSATIYTVISYISTYASTGDISLSSETEIIIMVISYATTLISGVGGCIYYHKLLKSMNLLSESYNYYG